MEIRPILSAMWRNRTGSVLVALQVALTLAVVVNCMFLAKGRIEFIARPSGIDIENIITAQSLGFGDDYEHDATIENDLRLLRELPGVIAVTSSNGIPMSGSGSSSTYRASIEDDAPTEVANYYGVDEQAADAFGVNIIEGRGFRDVEIVRSDDPNIERMAAQTIVTKEFAEKLFGDEPALGKRIYNGLGESAEVIGIIEHMYGSWVSWGNLGQIAWFPERTTGERVRYIIRAEAGKRDALLPIVEKTLTDNGRNRLVRNVRTMSETVANSYANDKAVAIVLFVAVVLLLIVTGLGIVGLASFAVRQRTKQIGTRRAVGARKRDIIRYFLTENWLMTTIGIIFGTVLAVGLNYLLAAKFGVDRLNLYYVLGGIFVLWLLGFIAVAAPARRAAKISPAIATRTV